jgi:hypothetical protein
MGYRIKSKNISFNLTGGFKVGYCLGATEKGNATASNGLKYSVSRESKTITIDIRPGLKLSARYQKFGLYTGYSSGLINHEMWVKGDGRWESYSRLVRVGIMYQIN